MLGAAALVAVLALAAASCGGSGGARPDLLLVSTRDGDYAIFELDADGSGQQRLTDSDSDPEGQQAGVLPDRPRLGARREPHRVREPARHVVRRLLDAC